MTATRQPRTSLAKEFPIASDDTEVLADWVECQVIFSPSQHCSRTSLGRVLRRTGIDSVVISDDDESLLTDPGAMVSQRLAEDVFSEVEERAQACGSAYPFVIDPNGIKLKPMDPSDSDYIFLLLLTKLGPTSGHAGTAALFEHLCSHAAHQYLGGLGNAAQVLRVGAPRRAPLTTFRHSVDSMCLCLKEGGGCRPSPRHDRSTGDGQLDIVAWREFPFDDRQGKLIAFGQCAAGLQGWEAKLTELDSLKFAKKYLREPLVVDPIRLFFVPWRVSAKVWSAVSTDAGIVFDRSRIVSCLQGLSPDLAMQRKIATKRLLRDGRGQRASSKQPAFHARTGRRHPRSQRGGAV